MVYEILSHNNDRVRFLMNEHNIPIDVDQCFKYDNIQALFMHYEQTQDIKEFIVKTSYYLSCVWEPIFSALSDIFDEKYRGLLNSAKIIAAYERDGFYDGDVNIDDYYGKTILHYVAEYFQQVYDLILENEPDLVFVQDKEGKTALHYAVISGNIDLVNELISNESANICDKEGRLPLHYAAISGDVKMALEVIDKTINIRKRDNNRKIPLHYAVDDREMFEALVYDYNTRTQYYELEDALECKASADSCIQHFICDWENGLWEHGDD